MQKNEKKFFLIAAAFYAVLILLVYFGSFVRHILNRTWYANASAIVVIFIWITVFIAATVSVSRGFYLIKVRLQGKERLDFTAKLGTLIADYGSRGKGLNLPDFFNEICRENGITKPPDLKKYHYDRKNPAERDIIFGTLRDEIEEAANAAAKVKKS